MHVRLVCLTLLLACAACQGRSTERDPTGAPARDSAPHPTELAAQAASLRAAMSAARDQGLPPEVLALAVALAAEERIESPYISAGGVASRVYPVFEALAARAAPEHMRALLEFPSPVVRGYMGSHLVLAEEHENELQHVYPLLFDDTPVETMRGCVILNVRVNELIVEHLELAIESAPLGSPGRTRLGSLALRGAADEAVERSLRGELLLLAARADAPNVRAVALRHIERHKDDPLAMLGAGLEALILLGDEGALEQVAPEATHADWRIRHSVARVLANTPGPDARARLVALTSDADERVRTTAARGLERHPSAPRAVTLAALRAAEDDVAPGLARLANRRAVELLLTHALVANRSECLSDLRPTRDPAVVRLMSAATHSRDRWVAAEATRFLERAGVRPRAARLRAFDV